MLMEEKKVFLNQFLTQWLMILVQFYQEMILTLATLVSYKTLTVLLILDVLLLDQTDVVMVVVLKVLIVAN